MAIKKVALIGANGQLGPAVMRALQKSENLELLILSRKSSKSKYGNDIKTGTIPDDLSEAELVEALQGQDAVVLTTPGNTYDQHVAIANAAVKAGVKRMIPADYGSVDSSLERAQELLPLYKNRTRIREYIIQLAKDNPAFSWSSLVAGHFFDWGLKHGLLGFDLLKSTANVFDSGERKWSATTLAKIGEAVVKVLQKEDETRNKVLYIQSFCVSQFDLLEALIAAGGQQFSVDFAKSEEYIQEQKPKADQGDPHATEALVGVLGLTTSNWEERGILCNDMLGLSDENMSAVINEVYLSTVPQNQPVRV